MSVMIFAIIRLVPGDPARVVLGIHATPELLARMHHDMHLDEPIYVQYSQWLSGLTRGDLGLDYRAGQPISRLILISLPITVELVALALPLAVLIAVPLGTMGAIRRGRPTDAAAMGLSMLGISVPDFWLGIMLILIFALWLRLLPTSGFVPLAEDPLGNLTHMILPAVTLATGLAAVLVRVTRGAVLDVLQEDYIRFGRARGLSERNVIVKHALRNAAIPIVTVVGLQAGYLFGGTVVIEQIFSLPGIGRMVLDATLSRNYPLVQAAVLMLGLMFVWTNLLVDLLYIWLNPRLRAAHN